MPSRVSKEAFWVFLSRFISMESAINRLVNPSASLLDAADFEGSDGALKILPISVIPCLKISFAALPMEPVPFRYDSILSWFSGSSLKAQVGNVAKIFFRRFMKLPVIYLNASGVANQSVWLAIGIEKYLCVQKGEFLVK